MAPAKPRLTPSKPEIRFSHVGEIVSELVKGAGGSQNSVAERAKMNPSSLSKVCKGDLGISAEELERLAKAAGMDPNKVFAKCLITMFDVDDQTPEGRAILRVLTRIQGD